jgi:Na+/melibiose symporter-like transporter
MPGAALYMLWAVVYSLVWLAWTSTHRPMNPRMNDWTHRIAFSFTCGVGMTTLIAGLEALRRRHFSAWWLRLEE